MLDLFGDNADKDIADQLDAYTHKEQWANRLILGDSLQVMNSLLEYEGMGGQVQMVYFDPPYGIKFGSNFQPFVRNNKVDHGKDEYLTREPEKVKAYRDTWELGLHSYLSYIRDRLLLTKEILNDSGSIFLQISMDNIHHVREIMDEVFGSDNFISMISYTTSGGFASSTLSRAGDFILWYAKKKSLMKFNRLYFKKDQPIGDPSSKYDQVELPDGTRRALTREEKTGLVQLPEGSKVYQCDNIISQGAASGDKRYFFYDGVNYDCGDNNHWKASVPDGMRNLSLAGRLHKTGKGKLRYIRFFNDFPMAQYTSIWTDIGGAVQSRSDPKIYAVQTGTSLIQRCMHMTSSEGDLGSV